MKRVVLVVAGVGLVAGLLVFVGIGGDPGGRKEGGSDLPAVSSAPPPHRGDPVSARQRGVPRDPGTRAPTAADAREAQRAEARRVLARLREDRLSRRRALEDRGSGAALAESDGDRVDSRGQEEDRRRRDEALAGGAESAFLPLTSPPEPAEPRSDPRDRPPRPEDPVDAGEVLNGIAAVLSRESAWLNGPESGLVSDALAGLSNHENLSEGALRDAIEEVLAAGALMLRANDDAEGAELARAAQDALVAGDLIEAADLIWDVVSWYPIANGQAHVQPGS